MMAGACGVQCVARTSSPRSDSHLLKMGKSVLTGLESGFPNTRIHTHTHTYTNMHTHADTYNEHTHAHTYTIRTHIYTYTQNYS